MDKGFRREERDEPPKYSRLFVIGGKNQSEEELTKIFKEFGYVEYVSVKRDHNTGDPKGFSYVKFRKTSEAADALEALNGKMLPSETRPLKVIIASNMKEGSNTQEDITATRLFIMVPKTMDSNKIKEVFGAYAPVEHVSIVHDRNSGEPRGLAYVNFHKFSDAARAFENCDESYRAKFAEPKSVSSAKRSRVDGEDSWDKGSFSDGSISQGSRQQFSPLGPNPAAMMMSMMPRFQQTSSSCRLRVLFNPDVSKDMFWVLFNIVPGLVSCDLAEMTPDGAISIVVYNNPQSAAYAMERINGFEYPSGFRLQIQLDSSKQAFSSPTTNGPSSSNNQIGVDLKNIPNHVQSLITNIKQATEALKSSGFGNLISGPNGECRPELLDDDISTVDAQTVCSAKLPSKQCVLPSNVRCEERLFFVLKDARHMPNPAIITDVFSRFGNLIDAACIRGKKCGYARYGDRKSANQALKMLDNEDLLGSRLKVEVAAEDWRNKRARID